MQNSRPQLDGNYLQKLDSRLAVSIFTVITTWEGCDVPSLLPCLKKIFPSLSTVSNAPSFIARGVLILAFAVLSIGAFSSKAEAQVSMPNWGPAAAGAQCGTPAVCSN